MPPPPERRLSVAEVRRISERTIAHYEANAEAFRAGTHDHDVSQNYAAFLPVIEGAEPFRILDLGCGPGRDVAYFRSLGHDVVGLDGSPRFVAMARDLTGCEILEQDFLALSLGARRFDGIFANASLFHIPTSELARVLGELRDALVSRGVLFSSNPRGPDTEGFSGERYGAYHTMETWRAHLVTAGFAEIEHYYRPAGRPRAEQPWLASVWRRAATTREAFDAGARLFDAGAFWEAHEAWEERWRVVPDGNERQFFQGLILIAAALHKLVAMGSPESALRLFTKGLAKLDGIANPPNVDVDLAAFREGARACARSVEEGLFKQTDVPRLLLDTAKFESTSS